MGEKEVGSKEGSPCEAKEAGVAASEEVGCDDESWWSERAGVEAELSGAVHFNVGTMSSVVQRGWRRQNGGRYSGDPLTGMLTPPRVATGVERKPVIPAPWLGQRRGDSRLHVFSGSWGL